MHSLSLRFGRRIILTWSYLLLAVLGCSSSLSPTYTAYCTFRFLTGMAVSGIIINGVSLSNCPPILQSCSPHISLPACLSEVTLFLSLTCLQRWSGSLPERGHWWAHSPPSSSPLVKWSWQGLPIGSETGGSCRWWSVPLTSFSLSTAGQ